MTDRARQVGRFGAAVASVVMLVGVLPLGLVAVTRHRFGSANPLTEIPWPWQWSGRDAITALSDPLTDDAVINLLIRASAVIAWVAIFVIVASTAIDVVHLIRHRGMPMPSVRGLSWAQPISRSLATGLLILIPLARPTASLAVGTHSPDPATVANELVVDPPDASVDPAAESPGPLPSSGLPQRGQPARQAPVLHVVQRGESVYGIAEVLSADVSLSTAEVADRILDANLGSTMTSGQRFTNPAYIETGWELVIPSAVLPAVRPTTPSTDVSLATPSTEQHDGATQHLVLPGDTLSDIAAHHLGDGGQWIRIFEANAGRDMGDGRTFTDPHLIVPGWMLDIPTTRGPVAADDPNLVDEDLAEFADHPDAHIGEAEIPSDSHEQPGTADVERAAPADVVDVPAVDDDQPDHAGDVDGAVVSTPASRSTTSTTSTSTVPPPPAGSPSDVDAAPTSPATAPIGVEHAAVLAAGVLALVGVRRRQRLRTATARARVPEPPAGAVASERRLRTVDQGERATRVDVALRAAAHALVDTDAQVGLVLLSADGDVALRLTAGALLAPPWQPDDDPNSWHLPASVPTELLAEAARQVGAPCLALVQLGRAADCDVLVDLEACGTLAIAAEHENADAVVTAITVGLATSPYAEAAHMVTVALPNDVGLGHRNAHRSPTVDGALELAAALTGRVRPDDRSTFSLRSLRTGGEMWEPAIVLAGSDSAATAPRTPLPQAGTGTALVLARGDVETASSLITCEDGTWTLHAFGSELPFAPVGLSRAELAEVAELVEDASTPLLVDEPTWADDAVEGAAVGSAESGIADDTTPRGPDDGQAAGDEQIADVPTEHEARDHAILVRLMGGVEVISHDARPGSFERSKTVELIAWLATHRASSTRTAARTALWELDVRDATFANVVSEARRGLARLVTPPGDDEWVARTLTDRLPLHDGVVTDADLMADRLDAARLQPPAQAIETLRPAAELIRGLPFAGTSYIWPDAEGLTSNLVLLATGVASELAAHALSVGDTDLVFWATGQGLKVLAGHEELIGLRMQAHARAGDLAGVRQEWESYERVIVADAWSDGEPAPKLLALRHELMSSSDGRPTTGTD